MTQIRWTLVCALLAASCSELGSSGFGTPGSGSFDTPVPEIPDPPVDTAAGCDLSMPAPLYMSPDDSNSMASPVLARTGVLGERFDFPVRPWEFLNYYTWDYPPAPTDEVTVDLQLTADADLPEGTYRFQIGIASPTLALQERPPVHLVWSVDTSGSMGGAPIARARDACLAMSAALQLGDRASIVTWSSSQATLLSGHAVTGPSDNVVAAICNELVEGGGTDLSGGLKAAYDLAEAHHTPGSLTRVVLISDGGANLGVTDASLIGGAAEDQQEEGIYLVGIGVGDGGGYNDALMNEATDLGRGAAVYLGDALEARRLLQDRFHEVVGIAARNVQIQLDLPPGFRLARTTAEEVSTDITEIEPQHLAPDDAMVFHQEIETCAPEGVTPETAITVSVTWEHPTTRERHTTVQTATLDALLAQPSRQLRRGAAVAAYAKAAGTRNAEDVAMALEQLGLADELYGEDAELAEIRDVLGRIDVRD